MKPENNNEAGDDGTAKAQPCRAPSAGSAITDTDRINWLEARPLPASIHGGLDDGGDAKFWGIGAHSGTLRETIDHMIRTGSERQKTFET